MLNRRIAFVVFDGFQALDGLELAVRVAVVSSEGPTELRNAADVTVDGPEEVFLTGGNGAILARTLDRSYHLWPQMTLEGVRLAATSQP